MKSLATRLHVLDNRQLYGNVLPYTHHLQDVECVLVRYGFDDEDIRVAAWGHDMVEDTRGKPNQVKPRDIEEHYGEEVAILIEAVTDEDGPNRKAKKALTYPKIRAAGVRAVALKLADRIANVEYGMLNGNIKMGQMYVKEYPEFRFALHVSTMTSFQRLVPMWNRLDELMGFE